MQIELQIQNYIADNFLFSGGVFPLGNDASFLREGVLDSIGAMELVSFVESQFGIQIAPHEVTPDNFDSVNKLAAFIRGRLANPQAPARQAA